MRGSQRFQLDAADLKRILSPGTVGYMLLAALATWFVTYIIPVLPTSGVWGVLVPLVIVPIGRAAVNYFADNTAGRGE